MFIQKDLRSLLIAIFASLTLAFTFDHFVGVPEVLGTCKATVSAFESSAFAWNDEFTFLLVILGLIVAIDTFESPTATFHNIVNVSKIFSCLSGAVFASEATTNSRNNFMLIKNIWILLLGAKCTFHALAFSRHRELMVITILAFLLLTVHAPPAFASTFNPKVVLISLFVSTDLANSSSAAILPNVIILIKLIGDSTVSAFDASTETSYPPMVLLTHVINFTRLNRTNKMLRLLTFNRYDSCRVCADHLFFIFN